MEKIKNIKRVIENYFALRDYIKVLLVFTLFASIASVMYFLVENFPSTDDPFFHIRFAEIIRQNGWKVFSDFPWLYFSKINHPQNYFIYYNFLFYLALIPFTLVTPLFLGIKLYGITAFSLGISIVYMFLLKTNTRKPFIWVVFIFSIINSNVWWRFFMARPFTLTPALMILELYFLYRKKYIWVFTVSFFYLYWHSVTFIFPVMVGVIFFLFDALYNNNNKEWKNILVPALGVFLALLVSVIFAPGFFNFIKDIYIKLFQETILSHRINIAEGNELYPVEPLGFIKDNIVIFILLTTAFVFEIIRYTRGKIDINWYKNSVVGKKDEGLRLSLFLLTCIFLLGTFISRRNADFFFICCMAYLPLAYPIILKEIKFNNRFSFLTFVFGIGIVSIFMFFSNFIFLQEQISRGAPFQQMEKTGQWLKTHTAPGTIIFHTTWNWFPLLFYYDTQNYYIAGIEPRFMYDYSPDLYWKWRNISEKGYVCQTEKCPEIEMTKTQAMRNDEKKKIWYNNIGDEVANSIKNDFHSDTIVTSSEFAQINDVMNHSERFKRVFSDDAYSIFIYQIQ